MNMNSRPALCGQIPQFQVSMAQTSADLAQAFALRYSVFVQELGACGQSVNHATRQETDAFDAVSDHLLLRDLNRPVGQQVIGVYRLLMQDKTDVFYTEAEYDLSRLKASGRRLLELGRSCVAPEYRGSAALLHLWQAVGRYVADNRIEVLFGTASFQGADTLAHQDALGLLHHEHLAPRDIRPTAIGDNVIALDSLGPDAINRKDAQRNLPALIKSYLRMGGYVGEGAFVDHAFNTTDVCMIVDVAAISPRQRAFYTQAAT